mmetsp:Transcript_672/g.4375  ORF Transcript_672/g.4375 Transcript_672/m.4375 type:complete len:242 (+) Transcript_672:267-992(+)
MDKLRRHHRVYAKRISYSSYVCFFLFFFVFCGGASSVFWWIYWFSDSACFSAPRCPVSGMPAIVFNTLIFMSAACSSEKALAEHQYMRTPDGMLAVRGISATDKPLIKSFIPFWLGWPCIPSATPSSTVARKVREHATGNAYVGSATERSVNQSVPPCAKVGTFSAMCLKATKKPMKVGAWTRMEPKLLMGWQSYFFQTSWICPWYFSTVLGSDDPCILSCSASFSISGLARESFAVFLIW